MMDLTTEQYREYVRSGQLPVERKKRMPPPSPLVWTPREDAPPGPVVLELPLPSNALHPNSRVDWRIKAQAKTKARQEAGLLARINRPRMPYKQAEVLAVFHVKGRHDTDNLVAWAKTIFDALQDGGVIENDRDLTVLTPEQVVDRKAPTKLVLTITHTGT